jgi:hypothetical protein
VNSHIAGFMKRWDRVCLACWSLKSILIGGLQMMCE